MYSYLFYENPLPSIFVVLSYSLDRKIYEGWARKRNATFSHKWPKYSSPNKTKGCGVLFVVLNCLSFFLFTLLYIICSNFKITQKKKWCLPSRWLIYIHIIYYYMRRLTRRRGGEEDRRRRDNNNNDDDDDVNVVVGW